MMCFIHDVPAIVPIPTNAAREQYGRCLPSPVGPVFFSLPSRNHSSPVTPTCHACRPNNILDGTPRYAYCRGQRSHIESVSVSDGGSIAGSEGSGAGSDRELRPVPKENGEAKGQGGPNTHAFFVDQPHGTLPARQVDGSIGARNTNP